MKIQEEEFTPELYAEMAELIELHHEEVASCFGDLDIDLVTYFTLKDFGMFKIVCVRDNEGVMIGYMTFLIGTNLHRKNKIIGSQDAIFIHPDYRKGMLGIKLMKESEKVMKSHGCNGMLVSSKDHVDIRVLYERLGFNPYEHTFYKELEVV